MIGRLLSHDWFLPSYIALCLMLGGASAAGALANGILNLLAIFILAAMWFADDRGERYTFSWSEKWVSWFILIIFLWLIVQLIPLPPIIWTNLPGRELITESLAMFGNDTNIWRSIALEPEYTIASMLWLFPPLAVLGLALKAGRRSLHLTTYTIVVLALISTVVGVVQLLQGASSVLYFYDITSSATSTGFFANSNHLATLLLVAMLFATSAITSGQKSPRPSSASARTASFTWVAVSIYLAFNLLVNRSLAGFGLAMIAICYLLLMVWGNFRGTFPDGRKTLLVIAAGLMFFPVMLFGFYDQLSGFVEQSTHPETRLLFNSLTWEAVKDFFPFGTGLGNFRWIYSGYEAEAILQNNYVNHVHNDWHELLLQGGIFAIAIICLFLAIFVRHLINDIRYEGILDQPERWAPYLAILMVFLHSFVDYPLRTTAISVITTFSMVLVLRGKQFNPNVFK